jgi:hypothetical protein
MADPLTIPVETRDPINAAILAISEDGHYSITAERQESLHFAVSACSEPQPSGQFSSQPAKRRRGVIFDEVRTTRIANSVSDATCSRPSSES